MMKERQCSMVKIDYILRMIEQFSAFLAAFARNVFPRLRANLGVQLGD